MKFWSASARFRVTIPGHEDHYEFHGPGGAHRQKVAGLHAQFENNSFDSEEAQRLNRWTDEQREIVEQGLKTHQMYGTRYLRELVAGDLESVSQAAIDAVPTCLFRVTVDGEVEDCGRPALAGNDHCSKHAALADDAPMTKPNRVTASA